MAGIEPARVRVGETTEEFMERRRRETAEREAAEATGRNVWAASTVNGQNLAAPRTADVVTLGTRHVAARARRQDTGIRYGNLYAPPPEDLGELRRQQAQFADTRREIANQNSWMAIPALAPIGAVVLAEGAGLLAGRLATSQLKRTPLSFLGREPGLAPKPPAPRPSPAARPAPKPRPGDAEENALRRVGRERYARAYGGRATDWDGYVHHRVALRFRDLFPRADPNRLANLQALQEQAHNLATQTTSAWVRSLGGRAPTQAEVMAHVLQVDKLIQPFILRAGIPKPPPLP